MRITKSRSLSSLSSSTVSTISDYSRRSTLTSDYSRRSTLALLEPTSPTSSSKRFRKKRESSIKCTRYTCVPCLSGDVNAVDNQGRSLLFYASRYGQIDSVRQLLEAGCDPNKTDIIGKTPLHEAIEKGFLDVAKVLLKEGVGIDVNSRDENGQTPFMVAVTLGQIEAVRLLHKYGANINDCDKFGISPLYRAIDSCWEDITEFLLDNSRDLSRGSANETCLCAIVHNDRIGSVQNIRRLMKTDYDFKEDADWLETDECPESIKENTKLYTKLLVRAGLRPTIKKSSSVKSKIMKTIRQISR